MPRLFRVFVSSSFLDMAEERRALAEGVFGPLGSSAQLEARRSRRSTCGGVSVRRPCWSSRRCRSASRRCAGACRYRRS